MNTIVRGESLVKAPEAVCLKLFGIFQHKPLVITWLKPCQFMEIHDFPFLQWSLLPKITAVTSGRLCSIQLSPNPCHWTCSKEDIPLCRGGYGINHLHDPVKGRVCTNSHVCSTEVIINWSYHPNNVQVGILLGNLFSDFTWMTNRKYKCFWCTKTWRWCLLIRDRVQI